MSAGIWVRSYNLDAKRMFPSVELRELITGTTLNSHSLLLRGANVNQIVEKRHRAYIWMLSTNEKDMAGNWVFADDIMRVTYDGPPAPSIEIGRVIFWKASWWMRSLINGDKLINLLEASAKGEVIGNVHENPDLLEGTNVIA